LNGGAQEAAEAFVGHSIDSAVEIHLPGRFEWRGPDELWDGAHNPDGLDWQAQHLPQSDWVVIASILRDKDVDGMLAALSVLGDTLVATESSSTRALPAAELARLGSRWFTRTEEERDPVAALAGARLIAGPDGAVLATGSLYLLADLAARDEGVPSKPGRG